MTRVNINPGICGFNSLIKLDSQDQQMVAIDFTTECPNLKPLELELKEIDAYEECFAKIGESGVYKLCRKYCKHTSCPVPSGIIKGIEVASRLALPQEVKIVVVND
ncbi:MAG: hypothetical protein M0T74_18340 [Desulfitobacterium hafniense]|nr:hypothetical protein [Desulfitobacterium hafniense]